MNRFVMVEDRQRDDRAGGEVCWIESRVRLGLADGE